VLRQKAQRSIQINDTIVEELQEVKVMLDAKSKQLTLREKNLKKRELEFEKAKKLWQK
jgi:hypothetical protein